MTIKCNADLFRIASKCQSIEATRYYLQGVYIEPHAVQGVMLTATDGHRMLCIHDETGSADESAIVALSPAALKECKSGKHAKRTLVLDGLNAEIVEGDDVVAVSPRCKIDGTFPDYRRAIPKIEWSEKSRPGYFDAKYLESFSGIAVDLAKERGAMKPLIRVLSFGACDPAVVLFGDNRAFGVLMPVCGDDVQDIPDWFNVKPRLSAVA